MRRSLPQRSTYDLAALAALALVLVLTSSCKEERKPLVLHSCPTPAEVTKFFQDRLKTQVQVADVKAKGSLCAYRLLLGESARAVQVYYAEGVYLVGIGIQAQSGKPFPEEVKDEKADSAFSEP